jgi:hypothetical protein
VTNKELQTHLANWNALCAFLVVPRPPELIERMLVLELRREPRQAFISKIMAKYKKACEIKLKRKYGIK